MDITFGHYIITFTITFIVLSPLDSQLKKLREETLNILMASELVSAEGSIEINPAVPGVTQYLQSLARIAISICVESPHIWQCLESDRFQKDLLIHLLQCQHYEVRLFALEQLLKRLQTMQEVSQCGREGSLHFELCVSNLTCLALHETHHGCQAKVRRSFTIHQTQNLTKQLFLHPTLLQHHGFSKQN